MRKNIIKEGAVEEGAAKKPFFKSSHFRHLRYALEVLLIILVVYFFKVADNYPNNHNLEFGPRFFGVTFSTKFCEELGLDWRETYLAVLDDLKVREIRLPIYWDQIEKKQGVYDFSNYDYLITEGQKRGVNFVVNIGWRLPRWPECHAPEWAGRKSLAATQAAAINMIEAVIRHYQDNPSIVAWQLENEPFFDAFGVCPESDEDFFRRELALVKSIDSRPVMVSATGELSLWSKEAKYGDIFGSTVYRVVWGPYTSYIRYPIPAWFYRLKASLAGIDPESRYVIELQAEPWVPNGRMIYLSSEEEAKSFNLEQFRANAQYAINIGFRKAYLWGVEWWYYKYQNRQPEYWEFARTLFKN